MSAIIKSSELALQIDWVFLLTFFLYLVFDLIFFHGPIKISSYFNRGHSSSLEVRGERGSITPKRRSLNPRIPEMWIHCIWMMKPTSLWWCIKVKFLNLHIKMTKFVLRYHIYQRRGVQTSHFMRGLTLLLLEKDLHVRSLTSRS